MKKTVLCSNDNLYSNNNNVLLEIVNDLQQLMNNSKDSLIIKTLGSIINKMNYIIKENQKNFELIRKEISTSYNKLNDKIDKLIINQEIEFKDGKYAGETVNGKAEGKGIKYYNNGDKYEGDWKNGIKEGKGIYYYNNEFLFLLLNYFSNHLHIFLHFYNNKFLCLLLYHFSNHLHIYHHFYNI